MSFDFPSRLPRRGPSAGSKRAVIATAAEDPELFRAQLMPEDFSFAGETFTARVVSVYDGDTVRLVFRLASADCAGRGAPQAPLVQWPARLVGYDAPEMHPRRAAATHDAEAAAAIAARTALVAAIGHTGMVIASAQGFDKYGRILVDLRRYADGAGGATISSEMIAAGHGRPYSGGKKEEFGADS